MQRLQDANATKSQTLAFYKSQRFSATKPLRIPLKMPRFSNNWEKLSRGVSKPGCFPLFSGKVQIVSQTLSGLFLVGALNRLRKRKRTNRENPRTITAQIGKIPEKLGKSEKGQKRTKREGQVQIGKPPRLKPPRLAALEIKVQTCFVHFSWHHFTEKCNKNACKKCLKDP